ncbi:MAG: hypothetical protein M1814_001050 [Vezdaea aestivalis]|nr:MAG: hypothetical protein M1814_001050 [Vezdaea aestivalis]
MNGGYQVKELDPAQLYSLLKETFFKGQVVIWFHGGGFSKGHKNEASDPQGLIKAISKFDQNLIWVSVNYPLGAFGWLTSPEYLKQGGVVFGGDLWDLTVMGESAGAAGILHHLTAWGGPSPYPPKDRGRPKFKRAILQSLAYFSLADDKQEDGIYKTFLGQVGAKDLAGLREADESLLQKASNNMTRHAVYGQFVFGPAMDETIIPYPPALSLKHGRAWPMDQVLVANNGDEGLLFTPPYNTRSDEAFRSYVAKVFPSMESKDLDYILEKYPVINTLQPRRDNVKRVKNALSEVAVLCNVNNTLKTFGTWNSKYVFNMKPSLHGLDVFFTFYNFTKGEYPAPDAKGEANAFALQTYLASWIAKAYWKDYEDLKALPELKPYENEVNKTNIIQFKGKPTLKPFTLDLVWTDAEVSGELDSWTGQQCDVWGDAPYWNSPADDFEYRVESHDDLK